MGRIDNAIIGVFPGPVNDRRTSARFSLARPRAGRIGLAVLLAATSIGWIGGGESIAAAPAELISVNTANGQPLGSGDVLPSVSGDGNVVAFTAIPPFGATFVGNVRVAVRDRAANTTTPAPLPSILVSFDRATSAVLSRDGCHVAFWSYFPGLNIFFIVIPPGWYVYMWDRCSPGSTLTQLANVSDLLPNSTDAVGPLAIDANGSHVAYAASSSLGGRIARVNVGPPVTEDVLLTDVFNANSIDISDDGLFVAIGGQTTVSDLTRQAVMGWSPPCNTQTFTCTTETISVGATGSRTAEIANNPSLSADGRYVAFTSNVAPGAGAIGTRQIYVLDRATGATKLVSTTPGQPMSGNVDDAEISPDGSQVVLTQAATISVTGKPNNEVLVARSASGFFDSSVFDLVSFGVSGNPTSTDSVQGSMSSNGRFVAFASAANSELSGAALANTEVNVWMRQRPIALDITPSLDFGTINPGSQSAPQNVVVTNTSGISINISSVTPPAAPFSLTANGCGGPLGPGATCAITVVFSPTAPGGASSSITVSGDGLSVSASLVGAGRSRTPGSLVIKPTSADYGSGGIGTALPSRKFVVSNPGQTAVPLIGAALGGTDADQFAVDASTCTGSLGPGAQCSVDVSATITRVGAMTATIGVGGTGGQSATAELLVDGITLKMNPGVVSPGEVTVAIGAGFPPNIDVELAYQGEAPFAKVHTEPDGSFRYSYLVLRNGVHVGGKQIVAIDQPPKFTGVRAPLLIDLATFRPAGFVSNPAFTSGVRAMVSRGG